METEKASSFIASKFLYFRYEARCSEHFEWENTRYGLFPNKENFPVNPYKMEMVIYEQWDAERVSYVERWRCFLWRTFERFSFHFGSESEGKYWNSLTHHTHCSDQYTCLAMTEVMEATILFGPGQLTVKFALSWTMVFAVALGQPQFGQVKLYTKVNALGLVLLYLYILKSFNLHSYVYVCYLHLWAIKIN